MDSQKFSKFKWTKEKEAAAFDLAEDKINDEAIAAKAGITRRMLSKWKLRPEFSARVEEHVTAYRKRIMSRGIADRTRRIDRLHDTWIRMQQVIKERAEDPGMAEIAGGRTGLLVRQLKSVGFGENNQIVEEFAVDTGLLKELREHERHAAQEVGQWTERHAIGSPTDDDADLKPLVIEVVDTDAKLSRESESANSPRNEGLDPGSAFPSTE